VWYKNINGWFFGLVTKHECDRETDGWTDRITTPKTASTARAVKMVHPMLSDHCPVLSATLEYCGQTVGCIKMKLGMQVGLSPGHIVLDGNPAPLL